MWPRINSAIASARASSFPAISPAKIVSDVMIGLLLITSSLNAEAYSSNSSPDIFASATIEQQHDANACAKAKSQTSARTPGASERGIESIDENRARDLSRVCYDNCCMCIHRYARARAMPLGGATDSNERTQTFSRFARASRSRVRFERAREPFVSRSRFLEIHANSR